MKTAGLRAISSSAPASGPKTLAEERTAPPTGGPVEDQWLKWDLPVLLALVKWDAEDRSRQYVNRDQVVQMVEVAPDDAWKVGRALDRLNRAGLIEAQNLGDGTPWPAFVMSVTPAGLRLAGAWPTPESMRDRLLAELEAAAQRIADTEPEKSKRLLQIVDYLRFSATELVSATIAKVLRPGP